MKKKYSLILWGILYAIFVYYMFDEFVKVNGEAEGADLFLEQSLFRLQKFLYNTSIFFIMYLFIMKLPFTSPMFMARSNEEFSNYVIQYGLKISGMYVVYSLLLHTGIPFIYGTSLSINSELLLNTARLFTFVLSMYFLYLYIYIKTNQQVLGLLSLYVLNVTILMIYFSISFGLGINATRDMEMHVLTLTSFIITMLCMMLVIRQSKYKDFV